MESLSHRILIIGYHFPPSTIAATFRPLRLARYLPELGHKVWVITASPSSYNGGRIDNDLLSDIPSCVSVTRVPDPNPLRLYENWKKKRPRSESGESNQSDISIAKKTNALGQIKSFAAELAKFPDQDTAWAAMSLLPALQLVARNKIDLICTTGPPFCAHLVGLFLKMITRKPWVALYGNPWTGNPSIFWDHKVFDRINVWHDRQIAHNADVIIAIDDIIADCIRNLGRENDIHIQPNGYDPAHFSPTDMPDGKFTITYAGSLYNVHNPTVIYDALNIIGRENPEARADMKIVFAGPSASHELNKHAPADIEFTGPVPHSKLVGLLNDSHVLLDFLTAEQNAKFSVSCKLYEYMAARRPILAVTPEGPLSAQVRELNLGKVTPCNDPKLVSQAILQLYFSYKSGNLGALNNPAIERFSAPYLVREFMDIVDSTCFGVGEPQDELTSVISGRSR